MRRLAPAEVAGGVRQQRYSATVETVGSADGSEFSHHVSDSHYFVLGHFLF
jgi:hypothetical protein